MRVSSRLKWATAVVLSCLACLVLSSIPAVRETIVSPLVLHDQNAHGDACYVLAGGGAIWERLDAAADLVQMGRVPRILLMQDNMRGQYSFKSNASWSKVQWAVDYLAWRGIRVDSILLIPQEKGLFGTLSEARTVARHLPAEVKKLVVVSSAPHMRRSMLAFTRVLPAEVSIQPFAATTFENSFEMYHPIWIEYVKLLIYMAVA